MIAAFSGSKMGVKNDFSTENPPKNYDVDLLVFSCETKHQDIFLFETIFKAYHIPRFNRLQAIYISLPSMKLQTDFVSFFLI